MNRFAALRVGYATLLLAAPGPVIRVYTGHHPDRVTRMVAGVLRQDLASRIAQRTLPQPICHHLR